jgi:small subunit ribosomal protein S7
MAKKYKKHIVLPDRVYNSVKVSKLINYLMREGKKRLAEKIAYRCFEIIKEKTKKDPMEIFELALKNVGPLLEVRSRRIGGATYQVPIPVNPKRRDFLALNWIIQAARTRKGKTMAEKLAEEFIEASENRGAAVKKRENVHKMAEANKAFAHFA